MRGKGGRREGMSTFTVGLIALVVTVLAVFFVPLFYYTITRLSDKLTGKNKREPILPEPLPLKDPTEPK